MLTLYARDCDRLREYFLFNPLTAGAAHIRFFYIFISRLHISF